MVLEVVESHGEDDTKDDLLQMLLTASDNYGGTDTEFSRNEFIVDNCKNIYLAGHETTAIAASWCFMSLAAYPGWQARAREEVLEICGGENPTPDKLRKMKRLTMVIQETLRLYPPVAFVVREALEDLNLGGISIPKGVNIQVPIPMVHRDESLWGVDSDFFRPERFADGIAGACKSPWAFMPFGFGSRTCLGQNFAMAELKIILSLTLAKFRLSLSPSYQHSPEFSLMIRPQHGVGVVLEKL